MSSSPKASGPGATPVDWDRSFITGGAYGTDEKLATRQSIYAFSKPTGEPGFFGLGMTMITWGGSELVVDVGCGNGLWLKRLASAIPGIRTMGFDLSAGMLASLAAQWEGPSTPPVVVADAQALPLDDHAADVVLLMHMLYHVADRSSALAEARRVLRSTGSAFVSTPGARHLQELRRLFRSAFVELRGEEIDAPFLRNPFDAERAAVELPATFSSVESFVSTGVLEIPGADHVVAHLDSQQGPDLDALLPPTVTWGDVLAVVRAKANGAIEAEGPFRVTTEIGAFVCRP